MSLSFGQTNKLVWYIHPENTNPSRQKSQLLVEMKMKPISRSVTVICDVRLFYLSHDMLSNIISANRAANEPIRRTLLFLMPVLCTASAP